ncbi:sulfotransferase domain-containing protein [Candidatus Cyanaurora vandensis]|uniref:sulfotransferase domain-containing protein n=1 Tax=Candidatus Cyanaurora vandensis TaxID=2714958 RepID=UPI00257F8E3C|nr:sulfotransferase domain-containing protein [Candidatus Cyanaurora vandensis]
MKASNLSLSSQQGLGRISKALSLRLQQFQKRHWQLRHLDQTLPKTPVFVMGCHRSGTGILMEVIDRCPQVTLYDEARANAAFRDYCLRDLTTIERLVQRSPGQTVVFKPICDAHHTDRLLAHFPQARVLWLYRAYPEVVHSAIQKWGSHQREIMQGISQADWRTLGWRGERLSPELINLVRRCHERGLSDEEGAALFWYLRNRIYVDLKLDQDPRVQLVAYTDLVQEPNRHFPRVYQFIGQPWQPSYGASLLPSLVKTRTLTGLHPEIHALCEDQWHQLNRHYSRQGTVSHDS